MGAFVAAGQRVELAPKKLTWLETIQFGNTTGRPVKSNSFWNRVLLDKDERGRFKDVPEEVRANWPFYTGTFAAIGAKGRPLGVKLEAECEFRGSRKTVVAMFDAEEAALVDTMVTCDHGLAPDKTLFLAPVNARTEKPIRTDEEVGEADTILLSLKGQKRRYRIQNRDGGVLEAVGDENTFSWIADQATLGLLRRDYLDSSASTSSGGVTSTSTFCRPVVAGW